MDPLAESVATDSLPIASSTEESTEKSTEESTDTAATQEGTPEPTPVVSDEEAFRKRVAELEPDELFRYNQKLTGRVGSEADRLARQRESALRTKWETEQAARTEQAEMERLRRENPYEYVAKEDEIRAKRDADAAISQSSRAEFDAILNDAFFALPTEVQNELGGKNYPNRRDFLADMIQHRADHATKTASEEAVSKARIQWDKEHAGAIVKAKATLSEAARKDSLSETNGNDPVPDAGFGAPTSEVMSQSEWDKIRSDPSERRLHRARYLKGLEKGLITH